MVFIQKEKEPLLSETIQNIINKSFGESIDCPSDDITRCKYKIMDVIVKNQDLLRTLHNENYIDNDKEQINGDTFRDVCIFNYLRLPDLKDKVKNYICFEVHDNTWGDYTEKTVVFRCVSYIDDTKTDWGIPRQDLLALIIKDEFDWSNIMGMRLIKQNDQGKITDDGYCYREIVYRSHDPLNTYKKINERANRH